MYLTPSQNNELDKIIKNFEVAYRSYIADKFISQYSTISSFETAIDSLLTATTASSLIQTTKFEAKIKKIKANKKKFYESIQYSYDCLVNKDYADTKDNGVLYVSEIIDLTLLFFNPLFVELSKPFETIELFIYNSEKYRQLRNDLSHPASSKILLKEAKEILLFISKINKIIDEKYYWYLKKEEIENYISDFYVVGNKAAFKVQNLNEVSWDSNIFICRDAEIKQIEDAIIGKDEFYRRAGSLVVYGYGGVGKTSLILEFIRLIHKKIMDNMLRVNFDFVLYFTNKQEQLTIHDSSGDLKINRLRCDINSFEDLKTNLLSYLNLKEITESPSKYSSGGLIFIDNFETFSEKDKTQVMNFIQTSPRNIQYILTSRNEEECEYKINLQGFSEENNGLKFIKEYSELMEFDIEHISNEEKKALLYQSQGNTLLILLALERVNSKKKTISEIIAELSTISSGNTEVIAEFMYKNTFDQTIKELQNRNLEVIDILKIIALYEEPVDIFSISKIANVKIKNVETVCIYLSTKLILTKNEELYSMSEFATKFIFFNLLPHEVEKVKLEDAIKQHKEEVKQNISFLEEKMDKSPDLRSIMADWKPTNYVDKIAITEVYALFDYAKEKVHEDVTMKDLEEISEKINFIEIRTPHPYIRFQKARIFKMIMDTFPANSHEKLFCMNIVGEYLERTIMTIKYNYPNIKSTKSYAAVLWIHALSLNQDRGGEIGDTIKYLEEAKLICERYKHINEMYYQILVKLSVYNEMQFDKTNEGVYLEKCLEVLNTIVNSSARGKVKQTCRRQIRRLESKLIQV